MPPELQTRVASKSLYDFSRRFGIALSLLLPLPYSTAGQHNLPFGAKICWGIWPRTLISVSGGERFSKRVA